MQGNKKITFDQSIHYTEDFCKPKKNCLFPKELKIKRTHLRYLKVPRVGMEEIEEITIDLNIPFLKTTEKEHLLLDIILNLKRPVRISKIGNDFPLGSPKKIS